MRLLIAYNASGKKNCPSDPDFLSENAVQDEVTAVYHAAQELGYHPQCYPVAELEKTIRDIREMAPEVIFNLCEGFQGTARFEMHIAALWDLMGIAYTGNTPITLGLAQDKVLTKRVLESRKIHTPAYQVFKQIPDKTMLEFPLITKPSREDASLGIDTRAVAHTLTQLERSVERLLNKYKQPILVERYIAGREFNISLLGNPPVVLAVSEIDFSSLPASEPKIAGYEAKWIPNHPLYLKTPVHCPAKIPAELKERLEDVAIQVFTVLGGRDYGRVDTRVDREGRIYVLEFNPNPDISADAGFSKAVRAAGVRYQDFIEQVVQMAMNRKAYDQV